MTFIYVWICRLVVNLSVDDDHTDFKWNQDLVFYKKHILIMIIENRFINS